MPRANFADILEAMRYSQAYSVARIAKVFAYVFSTAKRIDLFAAKFIRG